MNRLFAGIIFAAATLWGQKGFDVASIKPSDPLSHRSHIGVSPGGSFEASGVTLKTLIQQTYDVRDFQISGGPGWIATDKYEIATKDEAKGPSEAELANMTDSQQTQFRARLLGKLRLLLEDRFQLKVHRDTKELPVYSLVVAKSGSRLQVAPDDGASGSNMSANHTAEGNTSLTGKRLPIPNLARFLSNEVGRTVIDNTGLTGKYDFTMTFSPDLGDATGPSIFTAVQEQLGLKLDSQKAPVEVIVIDSVQKPSGN